MNRARTASLVGLLCASCTFVFPRSDGVAPGEVRGRAVRADLDEAAAFARVSLNGSNLARRTLADGTFTVAGLSAGAVALRLDDDADGDGWPDRGGYAAALLSVGPSDTTFVLLGDVALAGTMVVRGNVTMEAGGVPADSGLVARVYVTRGLCFALDDATVGAAAQAACAGALAVERVETGAEAVTTADSLGAFQLDGVVPGEVEVSVVLYEDTGGALGSAVAVAGPFVVAGDAANDPAAVDVAIPAPAPLGTRPVQVSTSPAAGAASVAFLTEPGRPSSCGSLPAVDGVTVFALGGADVVLEVPLGIWDVTVCDDKRVGRAFAQAALASADTPRWTVALFEGDACTRAEPTDALDCDGDGLAQLPPFDDADDAVVALFVACAAQCGALGEELGDARCGASFAGADVVFDCDDDADGQGDTTEITACIGAGLGNDLDGDRLCSTTDPFPQCTANDPVACPAGTNDVAPVPVAGGGFVEPGIPQCGEALPLLDAFSGTRDLEVVGDQLYVLGSSGLDRFPLNIDTGVAAAGAATVQNLVNFEEMGALLLSGTTLYAAGGPIQPNPQVEPSRLWVVDVATPDAPVSNIVDLGPASLDPEFLIPELDGAVISSRFVAADDTTVYVIEHTTGGDVIALDRAALASGVVDVVTTVDFALPIDALAATVVAGHLVIVSANGEDGAGPSVIFMLQPSLIDRAQLPLSPGVAGGLAVVGETLFVTNGGAVRAFDPPNLVELALPPSFSNFHQNADARGLALLDATTLLVGSSAPAGGAESVEERVTLFTLAAGVQAGAPTGFASLVDQAGFGVSATDELTVLGGRFVYPTARRSPAPQQVIDTATCARE